MLPVPLNSSKITSSIFEPVSTSAVARMVSDPPSSMLRAAPKNLFGGYRAPGVDTTGHDAAAGRLGQVVGPGQPGDAVEHDHDVPAQLDEPLGPLDRELGDGGVLVGGPVEGGRHHLALDRAAHVGDFFGPLVDEEDDEVHLGVVGLDGVGDLLQDRRLAGLGGRDDHPALALADRREQVDDPRRHVLLRRRASRGGASRRGTAA